MTAAASLAPVRRTSRTMQKAVSLLPREMASDLRFAL
jgi:hypothetical protein